ncbi:hypothetical protein FS749_004077 [Ceratobasidium sp. UAMH 11750]|nr:hypothetical protein FS749_004077 [Ceratobasidium sp. UAMH 11750]
MSSDGQRIISGSDDNTVRIWDAYTGTALLEPLQGHSDWVTCVATSSDGHRIVSGSKDKTVRTWDAHAGAALLEPLEGHLESVTCVAISSDGQYVISGSHDHTVRIWDMQSGLAFFEPLLLLSDPFYVVISPDSQRVVCASTRAFLTWRFPGGLRPLAFQDVFQNSPSSTTHQYFRVMSLQLSMLCDKQGWIRGSSGEPLLWIAPEYQRTCPDYPIAVISTELEDHPVYFDLSRLKIGDDWANIFG